MRPPKFEYNEYSNTIRLMPGNYMVAVRGAARRWNVDMDQAVPVEDACAIFETMFTNLELSWGPGEKLAAELNRVFAY